MKEGNLKSHAKRKYKKFAKVIKGKNKVPKMTQPVYRGQKAETSDLLYRGDPSKEKFQHAGSKKITEGMKKYFKKK
jgi:uncharacterized protein YhfF